MFPQFEWLDTAVSTVGTGVGLLSGVGHYVELESPSLSECFSTMIAGQLGFLMFFHVVLQVLLCVAFVVTLSTLMTPHFDMTHKFVLVVSVKGCKNLTTEFARNLLGIVGYINMTPKRG